MGTAPTPVRSGHRIPWTWVTVLGVTLSLVLLFAVGLRRDPRAIPTPLLGTPAPRIVMPLFSGGTFDSAAYRGRVLVVNFWASWCYPACYEEAPHLQRAWERYRGLGLVVVGVNVQDREQPARAFIARFGQTFPNGMDLTGRIGIDYGVYGVPETFIVDPQGRIVYKHVGAITEQILTEQVEPLLRGVRSAP